MINKTTNLNLNKPDYNEDVDIDVINQNADALDSTIGKPSDLKTTVKTLVPAINENFDKIGNLSKVQVNVLSFGAKGDGTTDDTTAINNAFTEAYNTGGVLYFPPGTYRITAPIGINTALTVGRGMPTIMGAKAMAVTNNLSTKVQDGSVILYDATGGSAIQIVNTNTTGSNYFYGGMISNIAILKKNGDYSTDGSIGLNLRGCVDYRLNNIVCIGFDIGFKNDYGWSFDTFGLTCVRNRIGILLDQYSNAAGFHGTQAHQNTIGVKILSGNGILFSKITVEGQAHGIVITTEGTKQPPGAVRIINPYFEANTVSGLRIGMDENGVTSNQKVIGVTVESPALFTTEITPFQLDNAERIEINDFVWGRVEDAVSTTSNTVDVITPGITSQYRPGIVSDRYSVKRRLGYRNKTNLVPNGFFQFPDLTFFSQQGVTAAFDTTTFPGETVVKLTIPTGTNTPLNNVPIKIDKRMVGKVYLYSAVAQKDSDITANLTLYNPSYGALPSSSDSLPTTLSKVSKFVTVPDYDFIYMSIYINNATGGTRYVYLKNLVFIEQNAGEIFPSPLDYESGLTFKVSATTTGTVVPLPGWGATMYEVMLQPYGNFTAYPTIAANQFTVTSSVNGTVLCRVIPKAGMMI